MHPSAPTNPEPSSVHLEDALRQRITEEALRLAPDECCGLLIGLAGRITDVVPARNELASTSRYRIDPRDHFAAIRQARAAGAAVIGAFHSHPRSPAVPSPTDLAEAWPEFIYLIVSLVSTGQAAPLRAWRLAEGRFLEVALIP